MSATDRIGLIPLQIRPGAGSRASHLAGWIDLLGHAVRETAPRIHRVHLQIADTVFDGIEHLAPASPAVQKTRTLHHLIAGIAYTSVAWGGSGAAYLAGMRFTPVSPLDTKPAPFKPGPEREGT